jgi:hypothetical protein
MQINRLLTVLVLAAAGSAAFAQGAPAPQTPRIDQREENQQNRIDQGAASGQLNAKEAARMEGREAKLNANEAAAKADGKVTRAERMRLHREAERNSRAIYRQKHDRQQVRPAG